MNFLEINQGNDDINIQKYLQQAERKKEYNRSYYQNRVKPKKETAKQELELLRERCSSLELEILRLKNDQIDEDNAIHLINENSYLTDQVTRLTQDNENLRKLLEVARQRNYELMMKKPSIVLPQIQGSI
jgi:hypothetical protein